MFFLSMDFVAYLRVWTLCHEKMCYEVLGYYGLGRYVVAPKPHRNVFKRFKIALKRIEQPL